MALEKIEIKNRFTGAVQFVAEIDAPSWMGIRGKIGLALKWAVGNGAVLSGAVLSGAVLSGAVLSGADWIPKIKNIHQTIYNAASAPKALDMATWHADGYCGTTHCRAGWTVVKAGPGGRVLEGIYGTSAAAALIYQASDPSLEKVPNWIASNAAAMADMKRLAELEAGAGK